MPLKHMSSGMAMSSLLTMSVSPSYLHSLFHCSNTHITCFRFYIQLLSFYLLFSLCFSTTLEEGMIWLSFATLLSRLACISFFESARLWRPNGTLGSFVALYLVEVSVILTIC